MIQVCENCEIYTKIYIKVEELKIIHALNFGFCGRLEKKNIVSAEGYCFQWAKKTFNETLDKIGDGSVANELKEVQNKIEELIFYYKNADSGKEK